VGRRRPWRRRLLDPAIEMSLAMPAAPPVGFDLSCRDQRLIIGSSGQLPATVLAVLPAP
jgi:hypothetical protein